MNYYTDVLKKYAVFTGRATRKEYWMFVLCNLIVVVVLGIAGGILLPSSVSSAVTGLYELAVLLPSLAVGVRRLHDTGRSGWWLLLVLIPFVGAVVVLVLLCLDSEARDNAYGPNPKANQPGMPAAPASPISPA